MKGRYSQPESQNPEETGSLVQDQPSNLALDALRIPSMVYYEKRIQTYFEQTDFTLNQRLSQPAARNSLKEAMTLAYPRKNVLFSIDCEAYEQNINLITEIGVAIYDPRGQWAASVPQITQIHMVIAEHAHLRNGRYVPDCMDSCNNGSSYVVGLDEAIFILHQLIQYYFYLVPNAGACLVGHDVKGDINWLRSIGIDLGPFARVDSQTVFQLSHGKHGLSLRNVLRILGIPFSNLHNAANDAYYTLLAVMSLCDPAVRTIKGLDVSVPSPTYPSYNKRAPNKSTQFEAGPAELLQHIYSHQLNVGAFREVRGKR